MMRRETSEKSALIKLLPLFFVLFIDSMGLGLLFPILNSLIIDPSSHFLAQHTSLAMREFWYGVTTGIFMLCWFFGAAILGDLSDMIGRKKALLICLIGACLGYLLGGFGIASKSLWLLILGRIIAGFTAGSQPIAQAAIVDVSKPENKPRNIGLILLAISLGFIFGPVIGGILSDNQLSSWFGFSLPLYFAAALSLINALLLWLFFKETFVKTEKLDIRLQHAFNIFISAFKHEKIRMLSIVLLIMILGWSGYYTFISTFVLEKFHYPAHTVSYFMAVLGCGFALGCGYLVNLTAKYFSLKLLTVINLFVTGIAILISVLFPIPWIIWSCAFIIGTTLGIGYSDLIVLFSNQVGENEQGWVMGVTGSVMALAFAATSFIMATLVSYSINLPLITAGVGIILSAIIMAFVKKLK